MKNENIIKETFTFKVDKLQKEFIEKLIDSMLIKYPYLNRDIAIYKMILEYAYNEDDINYPIPLGISLKDAYKICSSCKRNNTTCDNLNKFR